MQFIHGLPLNSVLKEVSRIRTGGLDSTQAVLDAEVATIAKSLHGGSTAGSNTETGSRIDKTELEADASGTSTFATDSNSKSWWRNIAKIGVQTASALEHAHGNRILHRDIKPANLMIDHSNNVWVTDFGLAKHLKQALDANPPRLRSIDRTIPKDLETIIHKCIASEPKERYQTASDLKRDLIRLLSGKPVHARRIGSLERMTKWCRRRPVVAGLCGALAVTFIAGIAGVTTQWRRTEAALDRANENLTEARIQNERADQHFREARESVDKFYTIISEQRLLREPGLQPLRKELMTEAAAYYRNFSQQYANDESLKLETGKALMRLVQIEGSYSTAPSVQEKCDEAIEIFSDLVETNPDDEEATIELANAFGHRSRILRRKDMKASMKSLQDSIDVLESAANRFPESAESRSQLAAHYKMQGLTFEAIDRSTGRTDRSLNNYTKAYALRVNLVAEHPERIKYALHLADSCRDLGITYRRMQDNKKAIEYYDEAVSILEPIVEANPDDREARRTLGSIMNSIGYFYGNVNSELDLDRAIELYTVSQQQYEVLSRLDPLVIEYQDGLGRAAMNLGSIFQHQGDLDKALESRQKGLRIRTRISAANPTAPHLISNLAITLNGVGSVLRDLDRLEEATQHHHQAREKHLAAIAIDPGNPRYKYRLIEGLIQLSRVHCRSRNFADAIAAVESIDAYTMPDDTNTVAKAAKEYLLVACKIGEIDEDSRSDEEAAFYYSAIVKSQQQFRKASERGLDLLKWYADDTDLKHFGKRPEGLEMLDWMKAEFGDE